MIWTIIYRILSKNPDFDVIYFQAKNFEKWLNRALEGKEGEDCRTILNYGYPNPEKNHITRDLTGKEKIEKLCGKI